jgi:hypothetical protein
MIINRDHLNHPQSEPIQYCLIGGGKVAKQMVHYFTLENIPFKQWTRQSDMDLHDALMDCTHALLLMTDHAIEPFIKDNESLLKGKTCVHFSGCLNTPYAYGAHPMQTLVDRLEPHAFYHEIPFVIDEAGPDFQVLLPGLPNQSFKISQDEKAYYHALCVMANHFTTVLWHKFFTEMERRYHIPKANCSPMLTQTLKNIAHDHEQCFTGPLQRGDQKTIRANLKALAKDDFAMVYEAFVKIMNKGEKR